MRAPIPAVFYYRVSAPQGLEELAADWSDRDDALIVYTSGTTGRPKGSLEHPISMGCKAIANRQEIPLCSCKGRIFLSCIAASA